MENTSSFKDILDILACPKCHGPLTILERDECEGLDCPSCAVVYPVREGIPVLLVEEALTKQDWENGKHGRGS